MTDAKRALRPRRRAGIDNIPTALVEWFRGERVADDTHSAVPWLALIFPDYVLLPERWLAWKSQHPDAKPPAGWEWLDDPTSAHDSPEWMIHQARKCAARGRRK